jgi:hypothetical protein
MEQLDYNLLYRWFVGLGIDDLVWHPTAYTANRGRLLAGGVTAKFLATVLNHQRSRELLNREHFTVNGTLVEAWASIRSFRSKDDRDDPPGGWRNAGLSSCQHALPCYCIFGGNVECRQMLAGCTWLGSWASP